MKQSSNFLYEKIAKEILKERIKISVNNIFIIIIVT